LLDTRKHNRNLLLSYWGEVMTSKAVSAIIEARKHEVEILKSLSEKQLSDRIRAETHSQLPPIQIEKSQAVFSLLFEDTEYAIDSLPAWVVHSAITDCMLEGVANHLNLSTKVLQWYAERVKDPKLLQKKSGRKKASALHHTIRRYITILSQDLGYTVSDAILFVAGAVGRGETYTKDIWDTKNK